MGNFLSKSKTRSDDYEKILSELDANIQKAEIKLSEIKLRERRWRVLFVLYAAIVWAVCLLYCVFIFHNREKTFETNLLVALQVFFVPVITYYSRKSLKWFYTRKQSQEEANLMSLRAEQKRKVEELKKKTLYYATKSLLDRYENGSSTKPHGGQQQQQQQRQQPQQQSQQKPAASPSAMAAANAVTRPATLAATPAVPQLMQAAAARPRQRQWYDRLIDAVVSDEGPEAKFALVCNHCFAHNGLVLPQEIDFIQYVCPQCKKFNPSRKSRQLHPNGPVIPPSTPNSSRPNSAITQEDQSEAKQDIEQDKGRFDANSDKEIEEDSPKEEDTIAARVRRRRQRDSNDPNIFTCAGKHVMG